MKARIGLLVAVFVILCSTQLFAHVNGMNVVLTMGALPDQVQLDWTGGQPIFQVYRATVPMGIIAPGNLIGETDFHTLADTPGTGSIYFYHLDSPCQYSPPEICDGLDNDCNGTFDDPGSEASCNLPHATPGCVAGGCVVLACDTGFGDCDGVAADGCENDLTASPHCGSCGVDCDSGLSACEHSLCADRACQPAFDVARCLAPRGMTSAGHCAFAEAGCASAVDTDNDGLGDTWEDAGAIDLNCDGAYDASDAPLPSANKKVKDVYLKISYMGGSPHPYPAADTSIPGCPIMSYVEPIEGHRPQQDSVDLVVRAFSGAHLTPAARPCGKVGEAPCPGGFSCVDFACLPDCSVDPDCSATCNADCVAMGGAKCVPQGGAGGGNVCRLWRLHVDPLPAAGVAHHDIVSYGEIPDSCANTAGGGSMTPGDQANYFDYKTAGFDPREAAFKHFMLFGHDNTCYGTGSPGCGDSSCPTIDGQPPQPGTTGISEIKGNDSIVSLAMLQIQNIPSDRVAAEASAILHEIGHNLGLDHGGPVGVPHDDVKKVNHLSVMNSLYQNTGIPYTDVPGSTLQVGSRPDFSHQPLTSMLDESALSEPDGVGPPGLLEPNTTALIKYVSDQTPICPCPIDPCTGLPFPRCGRLGSGAQVGGSVSPIDWNCDGDTTDIGLSADINGNGIPREIHDPTGTAEWISLFYQFQCESTYLNGAVPQPGRLASGATEQDYRALGLDLRPPLLARIEVQDLCRDASGSRLVSAILHGSATLDVTKVDLSTLRLGPAHAAAASWSIGDRDGDGRLDLKWTFHHDDLRITGSGQWLHLTGALQDGRTFNGRDALEADRPPGSCEEQGASAAPKDKSGDAL